MRHADDHIHILATTVRADGRRPRTNRDGWRAQKECRKIEAEFGLRRLKSGDLTASRTPSGAERAKAQRQGQEVTAREWLREQAYAIAACVHSIDEYFTVLGSLGIQVKPRISTKTGDVDGYSLAAPGDTIWYGGSKLAPDLSYTRLTERLPTQEVADRPQQVADPADSWRRTESAVRTARTVLDAGDDAIAQGYLEAFGDTLHNLARTSPGPHQAELQAAARAFNRARRSAILTTKPPLNYAKPPRNLPTPPTFPAAWPSLWSSRPCTWPAPPPSGTRNAATNSSPPQPNKPPATYKTATAKPPNRP